MRLATSPPSSCEAHIRELRPAPGALQLGPCPTDFAIGNFAQCNDNVSVIRIDERFGAFEQLSGSFCGELNQDEATGNFL